MLSNLKAHCTSSFKNVIINEHRLFLGDVICYTAEVVLQNPNMIHHLQGQPTKSFEYSALQKRKKGQFTSVVRASPRSLPRVVSTLIASESWSTKDSSEPIQPKASLHKINHTTIGQAFSLGPVNMEVVNVLKSARHHKVWYDVKLPFENIV